MLNTIKEFFKGKFNFKLMKCYKSIKLKMLNNNIGFWVMNIIIIIELFFLFYFFCSEWNKYKIKLTFESYQNKNYKISRGPVTILNIFFEKISLHKKSKYVLKHSNQTNETERKLKYSDSQRRKDNLTINKNKKNDLVQSDLKLIDTLSFKDIIKIKQEKFIIFLCYMFKRKLFIYSSFFLNSEYEILSINIINTLTQITLILCINSLFYDQNCISERYNNGHLKLKTLLIKTIFPSIISIILKKILRFFISFPFLIELYNQNSDNKESFIKIIVKKIKFIFRNIIIYFILSIIIIIFSWIYITIFCLKFPNTQYDYIMGCLYSISLNFISSLFLIIFDVLLIHLSIKNKKQWLYNISLFIQNKL